MTVSLSILYVNTKARAMSLMESLEKHNMSVECIHHDLMPEERNRIMNEFRTHEVRILISVDNLERGIYVDNCSMFIN